MRCLLQSEDVMDHQDAENLVMLFARRDRSVVMNAAQRDAVIGHLMRVFPSGSDATVHDVREIAQSVIQEGAMPSSGEFQQQSVEAQVKILGDTFYRIILPRFPYLESPFAFDANGNVAGPDNRIALMRSRTQ